MDGSRNVMHVNKRAWDKLNRSVNENRLVSSGENRVPLLSILTREKGG